MAHWMWDSSFSVGIEEIDTQHKELIALINKLNVAVSYKKAYMVEEVLKDLFAYIKKHFAYEESLMELSGYEHIQEHKKSHEAFVNRFIFFKERYENGEDIAKQLRSELQLWLTHHIKHDDNDYKECVQNYLKPQ